MIDGMNHGGKVALLGLFSEDVSLDLNTAIFKGLSFKGVYGREMFETWHKMVSMLQSGLTSARSSPTSFPSTPTKKVFEC